MNAADVRRVALESLDAIERFTGGGDAFGHERLLRLFSSAPKAFWRFDVDVSLDAAAKMARFAHVAGISGSFYILPTAEFYNPFSVTGGHTLNQIVAHGHTLGLHVDCRETDDPYRAVDVARRVFFAAYPTLFDLDAVSFHMPRPGLLWRDYEGFESAYASRWEGRYLSDSRREWGPEKEALVTNEMQIALHPEHWF